MSRAELCLEHSQCPFNCLANICFKAVKIKKSFEKARTNAEFMDRWSEQSHRAWRWKGLRLSFMLCGCDLGILTNFILEVENEG